MRMQERREHPPHRELLDATAQRFDTGATAATASAEQRHEYDDTEPYHQYCRGDAEARVECYPVADGLDEDLARGLCA